MKKWDKLPSELRLPEVWPYYETLWSKAGYRFWKRAFDLLAAFVLLILLLAPSLIIALVISLTSRGGPFFVQKRVGRYGKPFRILKFRTMRRNTEGSQQITCSNDQRVTSVGRFLRKTHLDEFPQLLNVLAGQMSFVGTRPEVPRYVALYRSEWRATLLMRPGITSTASYTYQDEAKLLVGENSNATYVDIVLPKKWRATLRTLRKPALLEKFIFFGKPFFKRAIKS